jgi:hypothetical protein
MQMSPNRAHRLFDGASISGFPRPLCDTGG